MATKDLERNDVDISKLFVWSKEFKIESTILKEPLTVYIRLVGDAEINRARVFALRKSAELRKQLKDENSDQYFALIADIDDLDEEQLISYLLLNDTRDLYTRILKEIEIPKPKELNSEASLEDQEKYQLAVDNYPRNLHEAVIKKMEKELKNLEESFKKKPKEELYKLYKKSVINIACETEMFSSFKGMCIVFGTFKDEELKEAFFGSYKELENLPSDVKQQFVDAYDSLEISMDNLKK